MFVMLLPLCVLMMIGEPDGGDRDPEAASPELTAFELRLLRPGESSVRITTSGDPVPRVGTYLGLKEGAGLQIRFTSVYRDSARVPAEIAFEKVRALDFYIEERKALRLPALFLGLNAGMAAGGAYWAVSETEASLAVEILAGLGGVILSQYLAAMLFHEWPLEVTPGRWEPVYPEPKRY